MGTDLNVHISERADLDARLLQGAGGKGGVPVWVGAGNGLDGKGWDFIVPGADGLAVTADSAQAKKVKWGTTAAGSTLDNGVDLAHLSRNARPLNMAWAPAAAIAQTMPSTGRITGPGTNMVLGKLSLFGGATLPRGVAINNIVAVASTAASGPTNQWAAIVDQAGNVLAKSNNLTTTPWAAGAAQVFPLASPYTPVTDIAAYLCLMYTGTAVPVIAGQQTVLALTGKTPMMAATAGSGLTTPASLGATVGALTAAVVPAYVYVT